MKKHIIQEMSRKKQYPLPCFADIRDYEDREIKIWDINGLTVMCKEGGDKRIYGLFPSDLEMEFKWLRRGRGLVTTKRWLTLAMAADLTRIIKEIKRVARNKKMSDKHRIDRILELIEAI